MLSRAVRRMRVTVAVVMPPMVQAVWVGFLLHTPVTRAPAAIVGPAYWTWWLSIPACAAALLIGGYRLIVRDYPDPRLDLALVYFSAGMLVLLALSVFLMVNR